MKKLNLDALDAPRYIEKNGQTFAVRPITPRTADVIDAAAAEMDPVAKMRGYYDAIALLIPTMPRLEVDDLSAAQVNAILELAGEQLGLVAEAAEDPNAASSAPTVPALSSETTAT